MPLVLDLRIAHDRLGSSSDPTLNGHLKYPNNLDQSLNDTSTCKIRKYRVTTTTDRRVGYHLWPLFLVRQAGYIVNLSDFYSNRLIEKLTAFLSLQEFSQRNPTVTSSTSTARLFSSSSKAKLAWLWLRAAALHINLNLDGAPIESKSHTHPSHSQTSRLLTSSLSLGVPVPRPT